MKIRRHSRVDDSDAPAHAKASYMQFWCIAEKGPCLQITQKNCLALNAAGGDTQFGENRPT
jgi:hypothetical protein